MSPKNGNTDAPNTDAPDVDTPDAPDADTARDDARAAYMAANTPADAARVLGVAGKTFRDALRKRGVYVHTDDGRAAWNGNADDVRGALFERFYKVPNADTSASN